jgi:hypothetical protein
MQAHDRRLAGGIVDRNNVEPAGALRDAAFHKEVLRSARQQVLLARRDA